MVADAQIPAGGRTVRCGRCSHQWHVEKPIADDHEHLATAGDGATQTPAVAVTDEFLQQLEATMGKPGGAAPEPLKPGFSLPVVARKKMSAKPFQIAAATLAAIWLILAIMTYFPSWMGVPGLKSLYSAMGAQANDGLVFADVTMERETEGSKTKFILAGSIRNFSNVPRTVSTVRVSLRDKADQAIWGRKYPVNVTLKAGEVYPFRITNVETMFADNVSSILVDMGHSLQLLVR